jgi:hypothetical protein
MRLSIAAAAVLLAACGTTTNPAIEGPGAAIPPPPVASSSTSPSAAPTGQRGAVRPTAKPAADPDVAGSKVAVVNGNFEAPALSYGELEGWQTVQPGGMRSYDFDLDTVVKHGRKQSLRITNTGSGQYGSIFQVIPADGIRGRTVELSGWIRTAQATGVGAQLTLLARNGSNAILDHTFMNDPGVTGSQDWQRYAIRMKVTKDAARVEIGAMLMGPGTMWLDDVTLRAVN